MNERTRTIMLMMLLVLIVLNWSRWMQMLGFLPPDQPKIAQTQPASVPSTQTVLANLIKPINTENVPTSPVLIGAGEEGNPSYAMQLSINPIGGGLNQVLLNEFPDRVGSNDRFAYQKPAIDPKNSAFLTQSIKIGDHVQDIAGAVWKVNVEGAKATLTLELGDNAGKPLAELTKTYEVQLKGNDPDAALGYEVKFSQSIKNLSDAGALDASTTINGPSFPNSELARGGDRMVLSGHRGAKNINLHTEAIEAYNKEHPHKDYTGNRDGEKVAWFGTGGNYFFSVLHPDSDWIQSAKGDLLNAEETNYMHKQVGLTIESKNTGAIAPGQAVSYSGNIYFGPRSRHVVQNKYYSSAGYEYYHILESGSICSTCGLGGLIYWLSNVLMSVLGFLKAYIFHDWGVSIIALVFIVRTLLHPITKKSQVNMSQMAKMGPEIERIKKKYANDQEAMNRAMMEFYKNHGATPVLGCLPMFLQMPIWISLYNGLSSTFDLRLAPFFYNLTWIKDLSKPDSLIALSPEHQFNLLFIHIDGLHILPILMSVMFYIQFKLQPKPPTMTPEQESQQTMMKWMTTLMFPLMLYSSPSGLTLYIFTSTLFGIIESKIIRKHIKEQEDKKASGIQFVDGEVIDRNKKEAETQSKTKKSPGWFARMQAWAEEQRINAEKEARKRKK